MNFKILDVWGNYPEDAKDTVYLVWDNWNDFSFFTLFGIFYIDNDFIKHNLGGIKIGFFDQNEGDRVLEVGHTFTNIGKEYFSVGTSEEYYSALNKLDSSTKISILNGLNDIAKDIELFERVKTQQVYYVSFLRSLSPVTITGQFRRMASGGAALTPYSFIYEVFSTGKNDEPLVLTFEVIPESFPPTNVHVIIGRNASGKTFLVNNLIDSLLIGDEISENIGRLRLQSEDGGSFANVISVSFSAFDEHELRPNEIEDVRGIKYSYIGLIKDNRDTEGAILKNPAELAEEFYNYLHLLKSRSLQGRWIDAIRKLYSDPNFRDQQIEELIDLAGQKDSQSIVINRFKNLSSGHKVVLLTITRLIEALQEKTLVIFDEPELYLHPPLLSAFIRAISDLLIITNGVAIIATHSPVVLQEVPKTCVWKLRRNGTFSKAERPASETFGENVGTLSSDVFALEVEEAGYYKMLIRKIHEKNYNYDEVIDEFNGQLGLEARSIAMAYISSKRNG